MLIIQEISQKIHARSNKYFVWMDLTLLLLITAYILSGINLVPFHGDESAYILMSEDYDRIVKQGDFERVLYNSDGNFKQYLRLTTGSVLAYSIGFVRDIAGVEGPFNKWRWGYSWEENVVLGNMPDFQILRLARICSAMMGALSIVLFFMTARQLFSSRIAVWTATLVLATHGDVLVSFRRAMQEGPKFLFVIITLYVASSILKDFQNMKVRRYLYILLGVASGFTLAAKQDTSPMLIAVYLSLAVIPLWRKDVFQSILINLLYLGAATTVAYACFLIFMPVFWGWWESALALIGIAIILFQLPVWKTDRIAKPLALAGSALIIGMTILSPLQWNRLLTPVSSMVATREDLLGTDLETLASKSIFDLETAKNRLTFLLRTTLSSRVMYAEHSSFDVPPFHKQIALYEASFLGGRMGSPLVDGFIAMLALMGLWSLLRQFNEESLFIYSLLITTGILLFAIIPLPWQRYFLIMQIPYSLIAGVGASRIWIWGQKH